MGIDVEGYCVADPDTIETPAMLVFESRIDANIAALCDLGGGGQNLFVHVKTHKSEAIIRKQQAAGIAGYKAATLRELEMILGLGVTEAILAYPMAQTAKVERFCDLAAAHDQAHVRALVSTTRHVELLAAAAVRRSQRLPVMLDLDVGLHRTGRPLGDEAHQFYGRMAASEGLVPAGLHVYDGNDHITDPMLREAAAQRHIDDLQELKARLLESGLPVPHVVAGNSFTFPYYARVDGWHGSPGTCVYWDTGYAGGLPDMPFQFAAVILTQVVDRYEDQNTFTTDLGIKAIASDPPMERRARLLGHPQAVLKLQNEEHGVFHWPEPLPEVGTYLLAVPGHVCPTTFCHAGSYVIDAAGDIVDYYPHTARDRQ